MAGFGVPSDVITDLEAFGHGYLLITFAPRA
jgi:hypothetical protein